ncbi:MAG TPA: hypothetical protein VHA11_06010 [Bryobacteraceae bacterium]|nr:hypothetical protein [Bryobacteraceae bacterium]
MNRQEVEKLLGGYATDTLTDAERRALFEAALNDQELFDQLAREQALRDLLQDPDAKQQLLNALAEPGAGEPVRTARRLWGPRAWALAGSLAAALIVVAVYLGRPTPPPPAAVEIAKAVPPQLRDTESPAPAGSAAGAASSAKPAPEVQPRAPRPQKPGRAAEARAQDAREQEQRKQAFIPSAGLTLQEPMASGAAPQSPPPQDSAAPRTPSVGVSTGAVAGYMNPSRVELSRVAQIRIPRLQYRVLPAESGGEPKASFRTGEAIRLSLTATEDGYLYLLERDGAGVWQPRYSGKVQAGKPVLIPAGGALVYTEPGRKVWMALLSRNPDPELENPAPERLAALERTTASAVANVRAATARPEAGTGSANEPAAVEIRFEVR